MNKKIINTLSEVENKYFNLLIEDREDNARISKKRSMRGVWRGIIDKYPDSAHFLYELLQNADDANASKICIRLENDGLLFKHDGKIKFSITNPLTEEMDSKIGHINSITSVGASTKETGDNKIGKFGVGFKAVFQYTQTPHIYDDHFRFGLNDYIVPFALESDHFWRNEGETLFWLPFDRQDVSQQAAYNEIKHKLSQLDNPILFLRNLLEITWQSEDNDGGFYRKQLKQRIDIQNVVCEKIEIINNDETSLLWLFTQEIEIESHNFNISAGLHLDSETNLIISNTPSKVYCFFPTKEQIKNMPFIIHAPFELVDSRQNIKNNDVNRKIVNCLAELCSQSLICLRDISEQTEILYLNERVLDIIPLEDEYRYRSGNSNVTDNTPFYAAFKRILSTERLILSQSSGYLYAENCYNTNPINIKDLFDNDRLNSILKSEGKDFAFTEYSSNQRDKWEYIKAIGINIITTPDFVSLINKEFMMAQPIEWLHKFYRFAYNDAKDTWNIESKNRDYPLRKKPIIRLNDGTYTSIDNSSGDINIFYPTNGIGFKCNLIDSKLLNTKSTADFFNALGVKEPDAKDYIINAILPQYTGDEIEIYDDEIREHLKTIYEYSEKCPFNERMAFIKKVSDKLQLVAKKQSDEHFYLYKTKLVYEDSELLLTYFEHAGEGDKVFLDSQFYEELFADSKIRDFVIELGVKTSPIITNQGKAASRGGVYYHRNLDTIKPQGSILSMYTDYDLENLNGFIKESVEFDISQNLWLILNRIPSNYYKGTFRFHFTGDKYENDFRETMHSKMFDQLREIRWLYTRNLELKSVKEITINELHENYFRNESLIEALGIKQGFQYELLASVPEEDRANLKAALELVNEGLTEEDILVAKRNKQQREQRNKQKEDRSKSNRFDVDENTVAQTLDDMFSDNNAKIPIPKEKAALVTNNDLKNLLARQQQEIETTNRIAELRDSLSNYKKYSYKWFITLLELEYKHSGEESFGSKAISIQFSKVEKEENADRIYTLKSPSRFIPQVLEEIGGLTVKFTYTNRDDVSIDFEVANVKDYSLRLKAKLSDSEMLSQIDFSESRAEVEIGNPVQLIDKLKIAYEKLGFNDDDNLKELLGDNLSFIFGPPGTGKTTHLSRKIIRLIEPDNACKILVLTPTNKACDVLANKIIENSDGEIPAWLARFVATGDETLEKIGLVCNRESEIYQQNHCCIITTMARFPYDKFSNSNNATLLRDIDWDYIIVDEASMIPLHYIAYTIYSQPNKPIIIAGDPFQIAPIIREELWKDENIYSMVNLKSFNNPKTEPIQFQIENLDTQYRSLPTIGKIFSDYTYDSKLKHHREAQSQKPLELDGIDITTVNYLPFKVDRYDSIFGAKKLSSSNIHIYSVLFTFEFVKFISSQITKKYSGTYRIGVICPYAAQAQLIEKLLEQYMKPNNVEISVGTIHGFQGDECDIVLAVFNTPKGIKGSAQKTFVNNKNIINVAISRARDYLFILMPNSTMENYENLYELRRLGSISKQYKEDCSVISIAEVEKAVFGERDHIEDNTFVTTHQMANVYSVPEQKYEVRIDENTVDIQVNLY